jgi:hypothetical protein
LVRINKEKEEAVQQARNDLQAKRLRAIEDEKVAQQDPSEPESTATTTSTLTADSSGSAMAKDDDDDDDDASKAQTDRETSKVVSDDKDSSSSGDINDSNSNDASNSSKMIKKQRRGASVDFRNDDCDKEENKTREEEGGPKKKKARLASRQSSLSSSNTTTAGVAGSGCGDDEDDGRGGGSTETKGRAEVGNSHHGGQSLSTSVSDITESQKESSGSSSGKEYSSFSSNDQQSGEVATATTGNVKQLVSSGASVSDSIYSDAAVAARGAVAAAEGRDETTRRAEHHHADVVIPKRSTKRKNPPTPQADPEATSIDSCFELDYEEVFLKSNVPQILATPSGRIVAHNEFFLRATGLGAKEVDRLTIFSLVQRAKLSNLFELVAAALRDNRDETPASITNEEQPSSNEGGGGGGGSEATSTSTLAQAPLQNYATMTLPCVNFHGKSSSSSDDDADDEDDGDDDEDCKELESSRNALRKGPLFMTVTLMADEDVRKRCFHCMFTDCPGTNGTLGSITPELLAMLFPTGTSGSSRHKKQQRKASSKKMRMTKKPSTR